MASNKTSNAVLMRILLIAILIAANALNGNIDALSARGLYTDRFETEIRAFEDADEKKPRENGGTVFVGSSTFTLWKTLESDFSEFKAINRGFGGSTLVDVNRNVDRIVTKYRPSKVVLYAGTNDIATLFHSGEEVCSNFKTFVKLVREKSKDSDIYFVSMSMAPSRVQFAKEFESGNECIKKFIQSQQHLHYVDVLPVMRKKDGSLRTELFGLDNLHMNQKGYALWLPIIKQALSS